MCLQHKNILSISYDCYNMAHTRPDIERLDVCRRNEVLQKEPDLDFYIMTSNFVQLLGGWSQDTTWLRMVQMQIKLKMLSLLKSVRDFPS